MDPSARRATNPPDFLVKLLTMVQEEDPDLINFNAGKLFIHDPLALERKMSAYFRHSNFSSFQRQLNNFGFRKVEGKGKLAPCMYMHDDLIGAPPDSLLRIRRKPTVSVSAGGNQGASSQPSSTYGAPSHQYGLPDAKRARYDGGDRFGAANRDGEPKAAFLGGGSRSRAYVPDELPPHRPSRHLEAFTGYETARPFPIGGGPVVPTDALMGNETAMHDAYESGLLLSFLEASDSGAIAPSLLSQLTGSDRFPAGFSEFKRDRDLQTAAPPPPPLSRDLNSLEEPRDLDGGDDFDLGSRSHFNIFGKKHAIDGAAAEVAPGDAAQTDLAPPPLPQSPTPPYAPGLAKHDAGITGET